MEKGEEAMTEDGVMQWKIAAGKREVTVELHHKGEPLGHYVFTSRDELQMFVGRLERAAFEGFGMNGWLGVGGAGLANNFVPRMAGGSSQPRAIHSGASGVAGSVGHGSGASSFTVGINGGCAGPAASSKP